MLDINGKGKVLILCLKPTCWTTFKLYRPFGREETDSSLNTTSHPRALGQSMFFVKMSASPLQVRVLSLTCQEDIHVCTVGSYSSFSELAANRLWIDLVLSNFHPMSLLLFAKLFGTCDTGRWYEWSAYVQICNTWLCRQGRSRTYPVSLNRSAGDVSILEDTTPNWFGTKLWLVPAISKPIT